MTLNQILYFRKVARLENYHQAAEELYISQPSLSRSMAALESELGITLFEKKGRGVVLTNAGRLFLEHADRIAGDCDIAAGKMKELASGGGKINIGYIFPLAGHYIPHNVRTFLDQEENSMSSRFKKPPNPRSSSPDFTFCAMAGVWFCQKLKATFLFSSWSRKVRTLCGI